MKSFLVFLLCLSSFVAFTPERAFAQELRQEETIVVGENEIINQDLFATGESITISGVVNGDTYVAGGTILVDGAINGDLIVAGGSITIRGPVQNDIRVFGGNIIISSVVGGNVTVGAGNVQITDDAKIAGGVTGGVGNIEIFAPVARGITMGAGQIRLANTVGGNMVGAFGQLALSDGAKVTGDLSYWSEEEASISTDSTVAGQLVRYSPPKDTHVDGKKAAAEVFAGLGGVFAAIKFIELLGLLLVGALLIKFAPNVVTNTIELTNSNPGKALLVGFVTAVVTPIAIVVLLLSGVGAPLALMAIALSGILYFVTVIFTALFVGTKVLSMMSKKVNAYGAFVLGLALITILLFIPVLGWLVCTVLYFIALGGLLLEKSRLYSELRSKDLI